MVEWSWKAGEVNPSRLVSLLREVLSNPKHGLQHGHYDCETPMDRLFSRFATSYRTFENKFLRAELAEKILIYVLVEESDLFRPDSDLPGRRCRTHGASRR